MTPEGKVKNRVKIVLAKHGAYWHMPVQNGMGTPSLDFICCFKGRYFAVETKAGKGKMTQRQETTSEMIKLSGGTVFLVNEDAATLDLLDRWLAHITAVDAAECT